MFVDIHTHNSIDSNDPFIRNLTFTEAEYIFTSRVEGMFSVGIHPWQTEESTTERMEMLKTWITDPRLLALGECGLDKYSRTVLEIQMNVFTKQIALSEVVQKPMIIHCVGYHNELLHLKKTLNPRQLWIIHGFRGKPEQAVQLLRAGCALSFGEHFNSGSVSITPLDRLFVETDESLTPISEIYAAIASIKNCSIKEVCAGEFLIKNNKCHD